MKNSDLCELEWAQVGDGLRLLYDETYCVGLVYLNTGGYMSITLTDSPATLTKLPAYEGWSAAKAQCEAMYKDLLDSYPYICDDDFPCRTHLQG